MATFDVRGARLHYRVDGDPQAPTLVLAHSLGTSLSMWDGQIPALTQRFRVVRYDMRGHGASSLSLEAFDIRRLGQDVVALLDALNLERVAFCGLSLGGMVGLWLGANAPRRVNSLVICNTAAFVPPRSSWDERIAAVNDGGMAAISPAVQNRWFTHAFCEREPVAVGRVVKMLLDTDPQGYAAACAAVRDMDQRESVPAVSAPTLVIAGTHDVATPPADGRWLAQNIAEARYVELPAAHLSNVEAESEFNRFVLDFLTKRRA